MRTAGVENVLPQEGPRRVVRLETWRQGAYNGTSHVPVAQLDKAPDYESGDWGFKSLLGYFLLLRLITLGTKKRICCVFFFLLSFGKRDKWACDDKKLHARRDSNPQPPDSKSDALSIAPRVRFPGHQTRESETKQFVWDCKKIYEINPWRDLNPQSSDS